MIDQHMFKNALPYVEELESKIKAEEDKVFDLIEFAVNRANKSIEPFNLQFVDVDVLGDNANDPILSMVLEDKDDPEIMSTVYVHGVLPPIDEEFEDLPILFRPSLESQEDVDMFCKIAPQLPNIFNSIKSDFKTALLTFEPTPLDNEREAIDLIKQRINATNKWFINPILSTEEEINKALDAWSMDTIELVAKDFKIKFKGKTKFELIDQIKSCLTL